MPTAKTTRRRTTEPQPRTDEEIVAEIYKLAQQLKRTDARRLIQSAVQEIRDRLNGKDVFF